MSTDGTRRRFAGRIASVVCAVFAACWIVAGCLSVLAAVWLLAFLPIGLGLGAGLNPGRSLAWPLVEYVAMDAAFWSVALACVLVAYGVWNRRRWGWRLAVLAHGLVLAFLALTVRSLDAPAVLALSWIAGGLGCLLVPAIHRSLAPSRPA